MREIRISGPPATVKDADNDLELLNLAGLKALVLSGKDVSGDDTLLQSVLDYVHYNAWRFHMGKRVIKDTDTSHVYLIGGTDRGFFDLPQWPIVEISEIVWGYISEAPNTFTTTKTLATTEYWYEPDSGRVHATYGGWLNMPSMASTFKVTWKAGFGADFIPPDLKMALAEWASVVYTRAKRERWDQLSVTTDTETKVYLRDEIPDRARAIFDSYGRKGLLIA